jgi:hypothetical protein
MGRGLEKRRIGLSDLPRGGDRQPLKPTSTHQIEPLQPSRDTQRDTIRLLFSAATRLSEEVERECNHMNHMVRSLPEIRERRTTSQCECDGATSMEEARMVV